MASPAAIAYEQARKEFEDAKVEAEAALARAVSWAASDAVLLKNTKDLVAAQEEFKEIQSKQMIKREELRIAGCDYRSGYYEIDAQMRRELQFASQKMNDAAVKAAADAKTPLAAAAEAAAKRAEAAAKKVEAARIAANEDSLKKERSAAWAVAAAKRMEMKIEAEARRRMEAATFQAAVVAKMAAMGVTV